MMADCPDARIAWGMPASPSVASREGLSLPPLPAAAHGFSAGWAVPEGRGPTGAERWIPSTRNGLVGLSSVLESLSNLCSILWVGGDLARPGPGPADRGAAGTMRRATWRRSGHRPQAGHPGRALHPRGRHEGLEPHAAGAPAPARSLRAPPGRLPRPSTHSGRRCVGLTLLLAYWVLQLPGTRIVRCSRPPSPSYRGVASHVHIAPGRRCWSSSASRSCDGRRRPTA